MRVYVAGKISGTTDFIERFETKAEEIRSKGYEVINPINTAYLDVFEYKDWIKHGLFLMDRCDVIYLMKGWEQSDGARLEYEYAKCMGLDVWLED